MNVVMADVEDNIGYMLLSTSPVRKTEYPFVGCKVHDGSVSTFDWKDTVDVDQLPFALNPKKGYFITANNRIITDNSKNDIGGAQTATGRSVRITEMISQGIKAGKKFTAKDMVDMQNDVTDVIAREAVPHITKIVNKVLDSW